MAKTINLVVNENPDQFKVISFGNVRDMQKFNEKILGTKDGYGRAKKSEFMEHYDKHDGEIVVNLDETRRCPQRYLAGPLRPLP